MLLGEVWSECRCWVACSPSGTCRGRNRARSAARKKMLARQGRKMRQKKRSDGRQCAYSRIVPVPSCQMPVPVYCSTMVLSLPHYPPLHRRAGSEDYCLWGPQMSPRRLCSPPRSFPSFRPLVVPGTHECSRREERFSAPLPGLHATYPQAPSPRTPERPRTDIAPTASIPPSTPPPPPPGQTVLHGVSVHPRVG